MDHNHDKLPIWLQTSVELEIRGEHGIKVAELDTRVWACLILSAEPWKVKLHCLDGINVSGNGTEDLRLWDSFSNLTFQLAILCVFTMLVFLTRFLHNWSLFLLLPFSSCFCQIVIH
jgi:hypothetical protein